MKYVFHLVMLVIVADLVMALAGFSLNYDRRIVQRNQVPLLQRLDLAESAAVTGFAWSTAIGARCRALVCAARGDLDDAIEALGSRLRAGLSRLDLQDVMPAGAARNCCAA